MSRKMRPFPKAEGGCSCGLVRYRLLDSPLFCFACHCSDCQHESGSAFSAAAIIEWDRIASIGKQPPKVVSIKTHKHLRTIATCPNCRNVLWSTGSYAPTTLNVCAGCFDVPGLMEPDVHIYIEDKIRWVAIPEGAKSVQGDFDRAKMWPKSSLVRLKECMERWEKRKEEILTARGAAERAQPVQPSAFTEADADDRTPTNGSPEPVVGEEEEEDLDDDEEFEKKADEIEKALQERLEKLTLKLEQEKLDTGDPILTS